MYTFDDLIEALKNVEAKASEVRAWYDNDGEETLNSFAFSRVVHRRSDCLIEPINEVQNIADRVLQFTQDDRLHRSQARRLNDAGFIVYSHDRGNVVVEVHPTDEAYELAETRDEPEPDKMLLALIEDERD
jgi:hypothetical protein